MVGKVGEVLLHARHNRLLGNEIDLRVEQERALPIKSFEILIEEQRATKVEMTIKVIQLN